MKIQFYKTESGYLIESKGSLTGCLLNGSAIRPTFAPGWFIADCPHSDPPILLSAERFQQKTTGWTKAESAANLELPEEIIPEDPENPVFPTQYDPVSYLYKRKVESIPLEREPLVVEWINLGEVSWGNLQKPEEFSFKLHSNSTWAQSAPEQTLTPADIFASSPWAAAKIEVADIQKAMTPEFAWHLGPCTIKSNTMFRLLRSYVKEHLNGKVAVIKSDYDFVFEVHKMLPCRPYEVKYTHPFARTKAARDKVHVRQESNRTIPILHITHAVNVHGTQYGAKIMPDFNGANLSDLLDKVDNYLADRMAEINAPLRFCEKCNGSGIQEDIHNE